MKKCFFSYLAIAFLVLGCNEIPPQISPITNQGDCTSVDISTVVNQQRNVLIEEFTGVRCVNCPAGSEAIEDLIAIHGDRLVAISIHAGFFSNPYQESLYDFRTPDGNNILSFLGEPLGFPTAVVNRKLFSGEASLQVGRNSWPNYVDQELLESPKAKLAINKNWDATTRELEVEVSIFIEEALPSDDVRISVMLTEDKVVDYQLTPVEKESDYVHKHVFRDAITNFDGNPIEENTEIGAKICKSFTTTIDAGWKEDDCHIIAYVHLGGTRKEILQVVQTKLN